MIKKISLLLLVILFGFKPKVTDSKPQQGYFELNGTIEGERYSDYIFLGYGDVKDSTKVINGKFKFTGHLDIPTRQGWLHLKPDPEASVVQVFLEKNNNIRLTLNYYKQDKNGKNINMLELNKIEGSETAILEKQYNNFWKINKDKSNFHELLYNEVKKLFKENPKNSFIGRTLRDLTMGNPILTVQELENLYSIIDTTDQDKSYLDLYKKKIKGLKAYKIGDSFISFSLPDQNSKIININNYRGRYLLVDFWASWCKPCRKQNRELVKLYPKLNKNKFDIISVAVYEKEENWKTAIIKDSLTWTNVIDKTKETTDKLGIIEIPFSYLLDHNGKIIGINLSDNEIEKIVNTDN